MGVETVWWTAHSGAFRTRSFDTIFVPKFITGMSSTVYLRICDECVYTGKNGPPIWVVEVGIRIIKLGSIWAHFNHYFFGPFSSRNSKWMGWLPYLWLVIRGRGWWLRIRAHFERFWSTSDMKWAMGGFAWLRLPLPLQMLFLISQKVSGFKT